MTQEINKDEAYRCMEIGLAAKENGDLTKALKFLEKAKNMYNPLTEKVDVYIQKIKNSSSSTQENNNNNNDSTNKSNNNNNSNSNHENNNSHPKKTSSPRSQNSTSSSNQTNSTTHQRKRASSKENASSSSTSKPSSSSADYTKEQMEDVQKIKKCKNYYEILGLTKTATDDDIKKAYRKMALKFHPDKNNAPGATDAFKAVSAAYACLRNSESRASYDRYGIDPANRASSNSADDDEYSGGRRTSGAGRGFQHAYYSSNGAYREFTEEDLFDIFSSVFGPGAGRTGFTRRATYQQQQQQQQNQQNAKPAASCLQFLQLLPLILLFLFSVLNFGSFDQTPPFHLQWSPQYSIQKFAQVKHFKLPYYVNEKFEQTYNNENLIRQVEKQVILEHQHVLQQNCLYENKQQQRMNYNAQFYYGAEKEAKLKEAKNYVKENCKKYYELVAAVE